MWKLLKQELDRPKSRRRLQLRVLEAMREVGVLLMAFAPLDVALGSGGFREKWQPMVAFLLFGFVVFALGALAELRLDDE